MFVNTDCNRRRSRFCPAAFFSTFLVPCSAGGRLSTVQTDLGFHKALLVAVKAWNHAKVGQVLVLERLAWVVVALALGEQVVYLENPVSDNLPEITVFPGWLLVLLRVLVLPPLRDLLGNDATAS